MRSLPSENAARGDDVSQSSREEDALWERYTQDKNDTSVRNQLVEHYLPIVRYQAWKVYAATPPSVEVDDLISAGVFGLMDALENFDRTRGVKFESYCVRRIRGAMLDELREIDPLSRLLRSRINQKKKIEDCFRSLHNRLPTDEEVSTEMGMNGEKYRELAHQMRGAYCHSINQILTTTHQSDTSEFTLEACIKDTKATDPTHVEDLSREFWPHVLQGLSIEERLIILLYYREKKTMKEVGEAIGLSESRVSQLHSEILKYLHRRFQDHRKMDDYLAHLWQENVVGN